MKSCCFDRCISADVHAGNIWEGMMRYAMAGTQGSAIAQLNLAWLLQRDDTFEVHDRLHLSRQLLLQAAEGGLPEAWVDAGNLAFWNGSLGNLLLPVLVVVNSDCSRRQAKECFTQS